MNDLAFQIVLTIILLIVTYLSTISLLGWAYGRKTMEVKYLPPPPPLLTEEQLVLLSIHHPDLLEKYLNQHQPQWIYSDKVFTPQKEVCEGMKTSDILRMSQDISGDWLRKEADKIINHIKGGEENK